MAETESPDLILMGIGLGEDNGLDVVQQIRAHGFAKDLPIIALMAHAMVSDKEKCIAAGCNDFEAKPVQFDRFVRKITKHLDPAASS